MTAGRSDLVDLEGELRHETDQAILFYDGKDEAWLPRSQIEIERIGRSVTVTMPEWLALEKGLI